MTIDSSGNVGINTTPEAWSVTWRALEVGNDASLSSVYDGAAFGRTFLTSNAYNDGGSQVSTWKRKGAFAPSQYSLQDGVHLWRTAATGAADSAIIWRWSGLCR